MGTVATLNNRPSDLSLDDRIANAFEMEMSSDMLAGLLEETALAEQESIEAANRAQATALDPATRPAAVSDARRAMDDAQFVRVRMAAATTQLRTLHDTALAREAQRSAAAEYAAAKRERDDLVKDLKAYDQHVTAIVTLLHRLNRNNVRLKAANVGQSAETWLASAEMLARGADREFGLAADSGLPELLAGVRLPSFQRSQNGHAWPPAPGSF